MRISDWSSDVCSSDLGVYVSINQLTIVLGSLMAQLVNWLIAEPVAAGIDLLHSWNVVAGWRWMFWACAIPALLYMILLMFIPESPRWLILQGKYDRAEGIFSRIGGTAYADRKSVV